MKQKMERLEIYCPNPRATFDALRDEVARRKWQITALSIGSDGVIRCICKDIFVSTQVENFLDSAIDTEYQISVE